MKPLNFIICFLLTLNSFGQNNPPIAVNDTIYAAYNDSAFFTSSQGLLYSNDSDPNNNIFIDTAFYSGQGIFSFSTIVITPITAIVRFGYKPPLNFIGIDSAKYVLKDNGTPVMYDTATIYFFVKHEEEEHLDLNNIDATIGFQSLFQKNGVIAGFEAPKGSGKNTILAANLWLAGKNQDSIFMNSETFGLGINNPLVEFYANSGPIMDSIYYKINDYDYKWDRFWKITNVEIQYHINNWNTAGYQPIEVIKNWPAHGDVSKGQAVNLAPFIDNNSDGIYNPLDGDYPKIKGQQAIYRIYNDIRHQTNTQNPMRTEVHYMAYAYNCASDSAINNTIFLDYTIYNRSNLTYDSTYIGMWTDIDLGDWNDDFMGCDVDRSAYYGYNGRAIDQDNPFGGIIGYGTHPPAQGIVFLKGAKQDVDGIDNNFGIASNETINGLGFGDGIADNEHWGMEYFQYYNIGSGVTSHPNSALEYDHYLTGKWRDGSQMVYGGAGHFSSGGTITSKYLFPDSSDSYFYGTNGSPQLPWSENNAGGGGPNAPGDRRGVGSTGPFTFEPDSSISVTLAFVFGRDYQNTGNQAGIVVMQERIDSIRSYYLTDFSSVCGGTLNVSEKTEKENTLLIYPNPFNNEITINYTLKNSSATLVVYNLVGEKITTQTITQNTTKINLSNLVAGIYFIKVNDGDIFITQKIIKQ